MGLTEIDFVCKAPDGKEVEELTKKELHKSLRAKISAEQAKLDATTKPAAKPMPKKPAMKSAPSKPVAKKSAIPLLPVLPVRQDHPSKMPPAIGGPCDLSGDGVEGQLG